MAKKLALLIGSEENNAKYFAKLPNRADFRCQFAATGSQAQIQLAFTPPALILLSPPLPDIPAAVILRQIKAHRRLRGARVYLAESDGELLRVEQSTELASV